MRKKRNIPQHRKTRTVFQNAESRSRREALKQKLRTRDSFSYSALQRGGKAGGEKIEEVRQT